MKQSVDLIVCLWESLEEESLRKEISRRLFQVKEVMQGKNPTPQPQDMLSLERLEGEKACSGEQGGSVQDMQWLHAKHRREAPWG